MKKVIPIFIILLFSCFNKTTDISLIGNIDNKVNCELNLLKNGDIINGSLLNKDNKQVIEISGTIIGNHLRLEEYAEENKLTGIFDGTYKDGLYKGFWSSPNNKIKVPFSFKLKNSSKRISNIQNGNNIKQEYLKWVKNINSTKGYTTNEKCDDCLKIQLDLDNDENDNMDALDDCGEITILEKFPDEVFYCDINGDGKKDAFIYAEMKPCLLGNWFINVEIAGHLVVFISNTDNSYSIIDEPEILRENIEFGKIKRIEGNIIYAEGLSLDENGGANQLGYGWNCKFEFKNNKFYLISKSKKIKYDGY